MSAKIYSVARLVLSAICILAAFAGAVLSQHAYGLLVDSFRFNAALVIASASASLLVASGLLAFDRRGGLVVTLVSGIAMLAVVVFGLFYMGDASLYEALKQASCAPGYAWCSNQASTVVRLCAAVVLGAIALIAFRHRLPIPSEPQGIGARG